MDDRKRMIENLQILRTWCVVNPRYGMGLDAGDCEKAVGWLDDALELLKAQQPRILTLKEATGEDECWFESGKSSGYADCTMMFDGTVNVRTCWSEKPIVLSCDEYGKTWLCWSKKPTDEEKAVKWE